MYFGSQASADGVLALIKPKLQAVLCNSQYGVDISIKPHVRNRTTCQNSYLWGIYAHIVEFWQQTGFMPDGLNLRFINSDFLHEYFKARFDIKTTTELSTAEFSKYADGIQNLMIEQTRGVYDPIYPEERCQQF